MGCGLVAEMFGRCAVDTFLIPQFEQVVQRMIQNDWAKRTINLRIRAVKQMFQYAMMRDLITGEQYTKIKSLSENRSCVTSLFCDTFSVNIRRGNVTDASIGCVGRILGDCEPLIPSTDELRKTST